MDRCPASATLEFNGASVPLTCNKYGPHEAHFFGAYVVNHESNVEHKNVFEN